MSTTRKTYHPQKSFDDALSALSELYVQKGWTYVSPEQLAQAAVTQRKEREAFDALAATFREKKEAFARAQQQRHAAYQAALEAARGANRNDPAVVKVLDGFKRSVKRAPKTNAPA